MIESLTRVQLRMHTKTLPTTAPELAQALLGRMMVDDPDSRFVTCICCGAGDDPYEPAAFVHFPPNFCAKLEAIIFGVERAKMLSRIEVRYGTAPGASFRVNVAGGALELNGFPRQGGSPLNGHIERFSRMAVLCGGEGKHRFFELEPGETEEELKFKDFFVRGRFKIVRKVNNAIEARSEWKKWGAANATVRGKD